MATARPVLNQLNRVARDFDATFAFYRRLGLEVPDGRSSPEGVRHVGLTVPNGVSLEFDNEALADLHNAAWRRPGGSNRVLGGLSLPSRREVDRLYGAQGTTDSRLRLTHSGVPGMRCSRIPMATTLDS